MTYSVYSVLWVCTWLWSSGFSTATVLSTASKHPSTDKGDVDMKWLAATFKLNDVLIQYTTQVLLLCGCLLPLFYSTLGKMQAQKPEWEQLEHAAGLVGGFSLGSPVWTTKSFGKRSPVRTKLYIDCWYIIHMRHEKYQQCHMNLITCIYLYTYIHIFKSCII